MEKGENYVIGPGPIFHILVSPKGNKSLWCQFVCRIHISTWKRYPFQMSSFINLHGRGESKITGAYETDLQRPDFCVYVYVFKVKEPNKTTS